MRKGLLWLLLGMGVLCAEAQDVSGLLEMLAESRGMEGINPDDLHGQQTDLNLAGEEDLLGTACLTHFQVRSLLDYRERYGMFFSWQEIPLIPGFGSQEIELLSLFFYIGTGEVFTKHTFDDCLRDSRRTLWLQTRTVFPRSIEYSPITAQEYALRPNSRYLGIPWYRYYKFSSELPGRFLWGLTAESDPGERSPADFFSFHVQWKGDGWLKNVTAGDFRARFGQGLLLWNGLSFGQTLSASGLSQREMFFTPYTSRDENSFFRGAGLTAEWGSWSVSLLGSLRRLDARVIPEGFTSLVTTGYHRTPLELEKKNSLLSYAAGLNISRRGKQWKAGITFLGYGYERPNARDTLYYNRAQSRDVPFGGLSIDFSARLPDWRFFSEIAADFAAATAMLTGVIKYWDNGLEAGLLFRNFAAGYTAAYGMACGRNSTSSNELSIQFVMNAPVKKALELTVSAYVFKFPAPRYLCHAPSYGWDGRMQLKRKNNLILLRQQRSFSDEGRQDKFSLRIQSTAAINDRFQLSGRVDGLYLMKTGEKSEFAWAVCTDLKYSGADNIWYTTFRVGYFASPSWDSRIYIYETDVQNGFSVPALYGYGWRSYLLLRYRPLQNLDLWIRAACTLSGECKTELKIQLKWRFRLKRQNSPRQLDLVIPEEL